MIRCLALLLCLSLAGCAWFRPGPPDYDAVAHESGLVTRDLVVPSEGPVVADGDTVAIHYEMRLADGTLIESSRRNGQPVHFRVGSGHLPRGVEEGVIGMRLFGRRRLTVPSELAFGAAGRPPAIPPDTSLVFDLELMEHGHSP